MQYQVPAPTVAADEPLGHVRGAGSLGSGGSRQRSMPQSAVAQGAGLFIGGASMGRSRLGKPPVRWAATNRMANTDSCTLVLFPNPI